MIIFELEGVLADCEHRRHFVDKSYREGCDHWHSIPDHPVDMCQICKDRWYSWKPDWKSFYEACGEDKPIRQSIEIFCAHWDKYISEIQIWTGRSESVRRKTEDWLISYGMPIGSCIKMRPEGDNTPLHELKEKWLDEYMGSMWPKLPPASQETDGKIFTRKNPIQFVFDSDPESIAMYRKRGIFVFDCNQKGEGF